MNPLEIRPRNWLRIFSLLFGVVLLFWLPVEDTGIMSVLLLSVVISVLGALNILKKINTPGTRGYLLTGLLAGLAVSPVAALLMVFKSGLHGHGAPDFTFSDIQATLKLAPYWGASGLLLGLGYGLWELSRQD